MAARRRKIARVGMGIGNRWFAKDGPGKAAAVSFYTMFAAAPLLFFSLMLAEWVIGTAQAKASAVTWLGSFISENEASALVELIHVQVWAGRSILVNTLVLAVLIWATSQAFMRLRLGIRDIFDETAASPMIALKRSVTGRITAIGLSFVSGLITAASFVLISVLPSLPSILGLDTDFGSLLVRNTLPGLMLTLGGVLLLRWIPDNTPGWSSTLRAASVMLVLFTLGRLLLEIYMQHSTIVSAYGAASALVVFLVWMYFSAQVFFFAVTLCHQLEEHHHL